MTVTASFARLCLAPDYQPGLLRVARKKSMRALTSELACGGAMLQDQPRSPCSKIEHRKLSDPSDRNDPTCHWSGTNWQATGTN